MPQVVLAASWTAVAAAVTQSSPAGGAGAQHLRRAGQETVRLDDVLEDLLVLEQLRTEQVQQGVKVIPVDLDRSGRQHQHRLRGQAQALDQLMATSPRSSQVMGLIGDHEVELRGWIEFEKATVAPSGPPSRSSRNSIRNNS